MAVIRELVIDARNVERSYADYERAMKCAEEAMRRSLKALDAKKSES
jgi:hypothetical protein